MNLRNIFIVISVFIGLNIAFLSLFTKDKSEKETLLYKTAVKNLMSKYISSKKTYEKLIDYTYKYQIQGSKIPYFLYKRKLYKIENYISKIYKGLSKYNVDKLFLVDLKGNTYIGFEHGKKTFRKFSYEKYAGVLYVYPLKYKDRLIGNVYFSIPFSTLQKELNSVFSDSFLFLITKDIALQKLKSKQAQYLIPSELSSDFYYEAVYTKDLPIGVINVKIKDKISSFLGLKKPFSVIFKYDKKYYLISFLPIYGFDKKFLGYLISYSINETYSIIQKSYWINLLLSLLLSIIVSVFIYIIFKYVEKFKLLAETDRLTGLYNKGKFNEMLKTEIERAKRYDRPFSLIIFDIDHFKRINDTYGHKVGDEVLKSLAKIIKESIRKSDFAARWGGEEFVILAPETNLEGARKLAEKLRKAVEEFEFPVVKNVTISLGVAQFDGKETPENLVVRADKALYTAKENGRNRVEVSYGD